MTRCHRTPRAPSACAHRCRSSAVSRRGPRAGRHGRSAAAGRAVAGAGRLRSTARRSRSSGRRRTARRQICRAPEIAGGEELAQRVEHEQWLAVVGVRRPRGCGRCRRGPACAPGAGAYPGNAGSRTGDRAVGRRARQEGGQAQAASGSGGASSHQTASRPAASGRQRDQRPSPRCPARPRPSVRRGVSAGRRPPGVIVRIRSASVSSINTVTRSGCRCAISARPPRRPRTVRRSLVDRSWPPASFASVKRS